jgi:hypothetical protein
MAKKKTEEEILPIEEVIEPTQEVVESEYEQEYSEEGGSIEIPGESYTGIKESVVALDADSGTIIDESKLTPFERIKLTTRKLGKEINDPNKSCKHCHGRGYTYLDLDGTPTPCKCLFKDWYAQNPTYKNVQMPSYNRAYRRAAEKHQRSKKAPNTALIQRKQKLLNYMKQSVMNTPEYREIVEAQLRARAAEEEAMKALLESSASESAEVVESVETEERVD